MKFPTKLMIALTLTLILSFVSLNVWAAPGRQGTVPITPREAVLVAGETVTLGTVEVAATVSGQVILVSDPGIIIGPAPAGLSFLSDAVVFVLDKPGDITISFPYPKDIKDKAGDIYKWDEVKKEWVALKGIVSGDPPMITFTDIGVTGGSYALLGG